MKSFYTYSFGCRVNEAEKEEIDRQMLTKGFRFDEKKPDIFIINTCSVTHKAEREARQLIYQTRKKLPKTKIIITGCSATYWMKNNLYQQLPIDMLIDNVNKKYLVDLIKNRLSGKPMYNRSGCTKALKGKFVGSGRVMIKIQDGCQRYCTFCIVPYLRGMPKSEKIKNLELKIKNLKPTPKEVILTAINTQAFGYDTKESFVELLRTVIDKTNVPRISLGSLHPWSLTEDFFQFYKEYLPKKRLINFFHIPLQSGSDKILTLMKRGYKKEEMLEKFISIKRLNKSALIGTDIIVGFLEETDKDFQETYQFLEKAPIDKFHIFRFSRRKKTQADYLAKKFQEPSQKDKAKRAEALIKLGKVKLEKFMKKNVGRISSALLLEKKINDFRQGLLDNQLPIFLPTLPKQLDKAGEIVNVKVIEYKNGKLFGKII